VDKDGYAFASQYIDEVEDGQVQADVEVDEVEVGEDYRLNDILYASNSYDLAERDKEILAAFSDFLKNNPSISVRVEGHTDNIGSNADNLELSRKRAHAVYDFLVASGVSASRIRHQGFGAGRPIASNDTEEGRAKNRRTVFVVTGK
jgi:outer membrane protein OmpA-like peptidoglycan-associated protein